MLIRHIRYDYLFLFDLIFFFFFFGFLLLFHVFCFYFYIFCKVALSIYPPYEHIQTDIHTLIQHRINSFYQIQTLYVNLHALSIEMYLNFKRTYVHTYIQCLSVCLSIYLMYERMF